MTSLRNFTLNRSHHWHLVDSHPISNPTSKMSTGISRSKETGYYQRHVKTKSFTTWTTGRTSTTSLSPTLLLTMIFIAIANLSSVHTSTTSGASNSTVPTPTTSGGTNPFVQASTTSGGSNSTVPMLTTSGGTNPSVQTSTTPGGTNSTVPTPTTSGGSKFTLPTPTTSGGSNSTVQTSTTSGGTNPSVQTSTTSWGSNSTVPTPTTSGGSNSTVPTLTTSGGTNPSVQTSTTSGGTNPSVQTSTTPRGTNSTVPTPTTSGGSKFTLPTPTTSGGSNSTVQTSTTSGGTNPSVQTSTTSWGTNSTVPTPTTPGGSNSTVQTPTTPGGTNSSVQTSTTSRGTNSAANTTIASISSSPSLVSSTSPAYGNTSYGSHQTNGSTIMISTCKRPNINGGIALSSDAGRTVVISCFSGFSLQGTNTLHCVDGSWNAPIPTCSKESFSKSDVHNQIKFNNNETPSWFLWTLCAVFGLIGLLILCCALYFCLRMCGCTPKPILGQVHPSESPSRHVFCACCQQRVVYESGQTPHHIDPGDSGRHQSSHRTGSPDTNRKLVIKFKKKQRAKDVLTWLPHRSPVRNINTSTK